MDASANQPNHLVELWQAVIAAWQAIPLPTLATLIDRMPPRVEALYDASGGHTKYWTVIRVPCWTLQIIRMFEVDFNTD